MINVDALMEGARDAMTVRRVFGDPYEKDGVTFVPAAAVRGGGGGGGGDQGEGDHSGSGGGFGLIARPVGAYRIRDGEVTWVPAADATRMVVSAQLMVVALGLIVRSIFKLRQAN